jgi:hypothetical protein
MPLLKEEESGNRMRCELVFASHVLRRLGAAGRERIESSRYDVFPARGFARVSAGGNFAGIRSRRVAGLHKVSTR